LPRAPQARHLGLNDELDHADNHGEVGGALSRDGGRASETLSAIVKAGVDLDALAADLQSEAPSRSTTPGAIS
jgi:hypothetical protein